MTKKEMLIEAAKEVFGEYGYADTTFKKISERAGVAFGLLTHHFGTKENLFLLTGLEVLTDLSSRVNKAMADGDTGLASILNFCREYLAFSMDTKSHFMVLVRCSPYSDLKTRESKESIQSGFRALLHDLEASLWRGIEDGTVREVPVAETAAALLGILVGTVRTQLLTGYAPPNLYPEVLTFIERSLKRTRDCQGPDLCAHAIY
ncbi:transcriptional regulator, TetR family [Desulfocurvibacter africanus PCS]|uniref:Transcriptional regulator, TetR family n=1 Tax=Desulfocurvibacter africanus PCS TaxID=1262666 RepID=M5PX00_DESAF|nr:TetR/AcrR family transcriptional regulator [Desulfocurvibacter africanus]EMG38574.1 transcriptional regulator, TetR family [Desulfocurvibacter africanus PCS]